MDASVPQRPGLRRRAYEVLEHGRRRGWGSRLLDGVLVVLSIASVTALAAETVPDLPAPARGRLEMLDRICLAVFALEYLARLWVAPEHPLLAGRRSFTARVRHAASPLMLIDLASVLVLAVDLALPASPWRLVRIVVFLKLARYSPALASIGRVLSRERRALFACVVIFTGVLLVAAAAMHAVEGAVQPDRLGDLPKAMWWAAANLAKLGAGGLEPVTTLGRLVSAVTVMLGIFCFALPVAIIGRGFYEEIRRRDFIVTFAMLARVPLFQGLDAASLSSLVELLTARTVSGGSVIVRKGDRGDSMYVIASGEVEVADGERQVRLKEGDFFGEMALLANDRRNATVTAMRATDLLVLDAGDFHRLLDRNAEIARTVEATAAARRGTGAPTG